VNPVDAVAPLRISTSTLRREFWNVPNVLTIGRIAIIPVVCWLLADGSPTDCMWATWLFGAAAFTDWLDGYIARKQKLETLTGKFLDPLADKLLVMAIFVTMVDMDRLPTWFVMISLAREISVTALRALAAAEGIIIAAEWGGKWKTAFQLVGLVCVMIHYTYPVLTPFGEWEIRFHRVGFALLLLSLGHSLTSGWTYFRDFLRGIDPAATPRS
jgi:CDP-diacylglycerol--glycerol-3-phosphate 3-phosphatidyltransferase